MSGAGKAWRVGSHYGIHVYEGEVPVATFVGLADFAKANAASVVADHNARLDAEPVGWQCEDAEGKWMHCDEPGWAERMYDLAQTKGVSPTTHPLYTHPPDATAELATLHAKLATMTAERDEAQLRHAVTEKQFADAAEGFEQDKRRGHKFRDKMQAQTDAAEARATAAEAALATAHRAGWIAGQHESFKAVDKLAAYAQRQADSSGVPRDFWQRHAEWLNEASAAIRALTPPAEAEGGRHD